jgi:hypothetical protein
MSVKKGQRSLPEGKWQIMSDSSVDSINQSSDGFIIGSSIFFFQARHLQGEDYGLTVDEVLDETKQYDVSPKIRAWLISEVGAQCKKGQMS